MKGQIAYDATDIIKNVTEELKKLSQNGFQECFQHPCSHWQKCTVAQRDHFEGNIASMIALF
jgi:ABC-type oligopeptide transport system ATPase subunit